MPVGGLHGDRADVRSRSEFPLRAESSGQPPELAYESALLLAPATANPLGLGGSAALPAARGQAVDGGGVALQTTNIERVAAVARLRAERELARAMGRAVGANLDEEDQS